jgi:hypothetical protein
METPGKGDPAKVTRIALQNASSIARLLLTTEVLIAELLEGKKTAANPHADGHRRRDVPGSRVPNKKSHPARMAFPFLEEL